MTHWTKTAATSLLLLLATTVTTHGQTAESAGAANVDVMMRGPIHEAFASPSANEPLEPVVAPRRPPEPIEEILPKHRPQGERVLWIPGYWMYAPGAEDFLWISGLWRDAPPGRQWVPGYWERAERGYRWMPGVWVSAGSDIRYQPRPPASQERGPSVRRPSPNHFYVPGCWVYQNNRYQWRPGYWAPHQQDWVWTPARYTPTAKGYVYTEGYWDHRLSNRGLLFAPLRLRTDAQARSQARLSHQPSVVLDSGSQLLLHLFATPNRGQYYFGDYYDPRWADEGLLPWYELNRRASDPLLSHYVWSGDDNFLPNLRRWNKYFTANESYRPRPTFDEHRSFLRNNAGFEHLAQLQLAQTLPALISSDALRLQPVGAAELDLYSNVASQLRVLAGDRVRAAGAVDAATGGILSLPRLPQALLPAAPQTLPANPIQLQDVAPQLPLRGNRLIPRIPGLPF